MKKFLVVITLTLFSLSSFAQEKIQESYVQVDGIVYDNEGSPLKYVNIISRLLNKGADTDENGIFSIISAPGDTLLFTTIGYKPGIFVMPEQINYPRYSIDVEMQMDTINIGSVLVLPWKTYGEFVKAVIEYTPPEEEMLINMENNLAIIERQIYNEINTSPEAGYRYAMNRESNRVMTMNQTPVNNLINPFAWSKFIKGLKNGLLKNQKTDKDKKNNKNKEDKDIESEPGENS